VPYQKNIPKYVMMPGNAKTRHPIVEQRTRDLVALAEETSLNRVEMGATDVGIIASGASYQYVKEVYGDSVSVLKLGMINPLPEKLIMEFASKVKKLVVVEELDSIVEDHCKRLGLAVTGKEVFPLIDEFSQNLVAEKLGAPINTGKSLDVPIPARPPVMCAGCPHRGLFYTLNKKKATALGDIGCYTLGAAAPLSAIDTCVCMGASISGLHGFNRAGGKNSVAVIGDSTFMHTGLNGLIDIAYNGSDSTVIILDNSITGMTGHQDNPTTGFNIKGDPAGKIDLEALCKSIGISRVRVIDPYDLEECWNVVSEEMEAPGPSVIISRRPCALLKTIKPNPPLIVDDEKCKGCSSCMKIGCPAISKRDKKAGVDPTLCVGCGVCAQLCKFDALQKGRT
jgi:indolepyruvate ferredoxin oxidoreductase alpha subunit